MNAYEQTYNAVVAEFGKQTKAKMYEWIDANGIIIKDRKNKTKEDIFKAMATFKMQRVEAVAPIVEVAPVVVKKAEVKVVKKPVVVESEDEEEEEDDGFEDCSVCGYAHHYEDKCPNETTCEHYEKSEEEEDSDDDVPVAQLIKRKVAEKKAEEESEEDDSEDESEMETNGHWFSDNCTVAFLEKQIKYHKETVRLMEERIAVLKADKKRKARAQKNQVPLRPTYNLKGTNGIGETLTLFRHYRQKVGICKYAVYSNTANNYVECEFDGETVSGMGKGKIHKTLNAWTTSNWREHRIKTKEPKKTVKNNAYKETDFTPLVMVGLLVFGVEGKVVWKSSMTITDNESKLKVQLEANGKKKPVVKYVKA